MIEQLDFSAAASASQRKPRAGLIVSGLVSTEVDLGDCKLHAKSEHLERLREPRDGTQATKTLILYVAECTADRQERADRSKAAISLWARRLAVLRCDVLKSKF